MIKKDSRWLFFFIGALPAISFVKPIGRIIDHSPSRQVLRLSDFSASIFAAIVALFFSQGAFSLALIFISDFFIALSQAFIDPTLNKAVLELLDEKILSKGLGF